MQCEKCKIKRATVFFTELDRTRHALCAYCASETRGNPIFSHDDTSDKVSVLTSNMYELVHNTNKIYRTKNLVGNSLTCSACGTEINDALSSGLLGCPECYKIFSDEIQFLDYKYSSYSIFNNKMPKRYAIRKETEKIIESLREKLSGAITSENYEYAAKLRDEIKALSIAQKGI